MGGINPYMIPEAYMPQDTYVSQHVPLPLEELDKALTKREGEVNQLETQRLTALEEQLMAAPQDSEERAKLVAEHQAAVEGFAFNLADTINDPDKFQKSLKDWSAYKRKFARGLHPQTGEWGAINTAYKARQGEFARIDAMEHLNNQEKSNLKMQVDDQYKGVLEGYGGAGTTYGKYGSAGDVLYQDIEKQVQTYMKEMEPRLYANVGYNEEGKLEATPHYWRLVESAFGPEGLERWRNRYLKDENTLKILTEEMIDRGVQSILDLPENAAYIDRISGIDAITKDDEKGVYVDEDKKARIKEARRNSWRRLGMSIYPQYERTADQEQQFDRVPKLWSKEFGIGQDLPETPIQSEVSYKGTPETTLNSGILTSDQIQQANTTENGAAKYGAANEPLDAENIPKQLEDKQNDLSTQKQAMLTRMKNEGELGKLGTKADGSWNEEILDVVMGDKTGKYKVSDASRAAYNNLKRQEVYNDVHTKNAHKAGVERVKGKKDTHGKTKEFYIDNKDPQGVTHAVVDGIGGGGDDISEWSVNNNLHPMYEDLTNPAIFNKGVDADGNPIPLSKEEAVQLTKEITGVIFEEFADDAKFYTNEYLGGMQRDMDYFNPIEDIWNQITKLDERRTDWETSNATNRLETLPSVQRLGLSEQLTDYIDEAEDSENWTVNGGDYEGFTTIGYAKSASIQRKAVELDYNQGRADYLNKNLAQVQANVKVKDTLPVFERNTKTGKLQQAQGRAKEGKTAAIGEVLISQQEDRLNEDDGMNILNSTLKNFKVGDKVVNDMTVGDYFKDVQEEYVDEQMKDSKFNLKYVPYSSSIGGHAWQIGITTTVGNNPVEKAVGYIPYEDINITSSSLPNNFTKNLGNLAKMKGFFIEGNISEEEIPTEGITEPLFRNNGATHIMFTKAGKLRAKVNGKWLTPEESEHNYINNGTFK